MGCEALAIGFRQAGVNALRLCCVRQPLHEDRRTAAPPAHGYDVGRGIHPSSTFIIHPGLRLSSLVCTCRDVLRTS